MRALRRSTPRPSRFIRTAAVAVIGAVAFGGLLAVPTVADAAPTLHLDQSNGTGAERGSMAAVANSSQTFRAGTSGGLGQVDVLESWYGWASQTLSIYPATSWGAADTAQGPLAVAPVSSAGGYAWVTATFTEPAELVAGRQYALVRNGPGQLVTSGDQYPNGTANVGGGGVDWVFRTYMDWSPRISGGPGTVTVPVGSAYTASFAVVGTPAPDLSVVGGTLPPGLTLTAAGLSGTPTTTGTYDFTVSASNADGAATVPASITVRPRTAPAAPTGITVHPDRTSALVAWTPGAAGDDPTTFTVTAAPGGATCTTTQASCSVEGLTPGTAYSFSVQASSVAGSAVPSTPTASTTTDVPLAPTGLVAISADGSVHLAWQPSVERGEAVTGYRVEVADPSGATDVRDTTERELDVTGLANGREYGFRVTADSAVGRSDAATTTAVPAAPASAPSALTAVSGPSSAVLTWATPADDGGTAVTGYDVEYRTVGGDWTPALTGASSPATVTGLADGSAYQFRIRAVTAAGAGEWTAEPDTTDAVEPFTFGGAFTGTPAAADGSVQVGAPVGFDATGLPVGATVQLELHSTPVVLATSTVDTDGAVHIRTVLPSNAEIGDHRLIATITGDDVATQTVASEPFTIALVATVPTDGQDPTDGTDPTDGQDPTDGTDPTDGQDPDVGTEPSDPAGPADPAVPVVETSGTTAPNGSTTAATGRAAEAPAPRLAYTGSDGAPEMLVLAGSMVLVGIALTVVRRRRANTTRAATRVRR